MAKTIPLPRTQELQGVQLTGNVGALQAPVFSGAASLANSVQPYKFRPPAKVVYPAMKPQIDEVGPSLSPDTVENVTQSLIDSASKLVDSWATKDAAKAASDLQGKYYESMYDEETGYYNLKGEAAVKGKSAAIQRADDLANEALSNVDPYVRAKLFQNAMDQKEKNKLYISSYAHQQDAEWDKATEKLREESLLKNLIPSALSGEMSIEKLEQGILEIPHLRGEGDEAKAKQYEMTEKGITQIITQAYEQAGEARGMVGPIVKKLREHKWANGYQLDETVIQEAIEKGESDYYLNRNRVDADRRHKQSTRQRVHEEILEEYRNKGDKAGYDAYVAALPSADKTSVNRLLNIHEDQDAGDTLNEGSEEYYDYADRVDNAEGANDLRAIDEEEAIYDLHKSDVQRIRNRIRNKINGKITNDKAAIKNHFKGILYGKGSKKQMMGYSLPLDQKSAYNQVVGDQVSEIMDRAAKLLKGDAEGKGALSKIQVIDEISKDLKEFRGVTIYAGSYFMEATPDELAGAMNMLELEAAQGMIGSKVKRDESEKILYNRQLRQKLERAGIKEPVDALTQAKVVKKKTAEPDGKNLSKMEAYRKAHQTGKSEAEEEKDPIMKSAEIVEKKLSKMEKYKKAHEIPGPDYLQMAVDKVAGLVKPIWSWESGVVQRYNKSLNRASQPPAEIQVNESSKRIHANANKMYYDEMSYITLYPGESSVPVLRKHIEKAIEMEFGDNLPSDVKQHAVEDILNSRIGFDFMEKAQSKIEQKPVTVAPGYKKIAAKINKKYGPLKGYNKNHDVPYISPFMYRKYFREGGKGVKQKLPIIEHTINGNGIGNVVRVEDGDTIIVKRKGKNQSIRLIGIDTPETRKKNQPDQPYGRKAKQFLQELTKDQQVLIQEYGVDQYNRVIGELFVGSTNVNMELVKRGFAEAYHGEPPEGFDLEPYWKAETKRKNLTREQKLRIFEEAE